MLAVLVGKLLEQPVDEHVLQIVLVAHCTLAFHGTELHHARRGRCVASAIVSVARCSLLVELVVERDVLEHDLFTIVLVINDFYNLISGQFVDRSPTSIFIP